MKFSLTCVMCLIYPIKSVSSTELGNLSTSGRQLGNHPSCTIILNTWWPDREKHINRGKISEWDKTCLKFNGDKPACIHPGPDRQSYFNNNKINIYERDHTPCVMLGAHTDKCVSNPCNYYNIGTCTIQETGGLCMWYTKEEAVLYNREYGCHRNPCHIGGEGKTSQKDCKARGIPGLLECTYCKGKGPFRGKGMGCQQIATTTVAQCAPVNEPKVDKSTIWISKKNNRCQCSDDTLFCLDSLAKSLDFVKRFPNHNGL